MGQRQQIRIKMSDMTVYIVDRVGLCSGTLENMSCFGLCVTGIPRAVQASNGRLDAVVFGRGYNFKLHLQHRWETQVGGTVTIGVAIEDIPWGWADLSMRQEILAKESYVSVSTLKLMKARKKPGRKVRLSRDW
jgi:hypothetical protein